MSSTASASADSFLDRAAALYYNIEHPAFRQREGPRMAALRYILLAAAITLTLALLAHLLLPARAPIPRCTGRRGGLGIAVLTAVYAVAAFWNLGSAHDPQRSARSRRRIRRARARARDCHRYRMVLPRPVYRRVHPRLFDRRRDLHARRARCRRAMPTFSNGSSRK